MNRKRNYSNYKRKFKSKFVFLIKQLTKIDIFLKEKSESSLSAIRDFRQQVDFISKTIRLVLCFLQLERITMLHCSEFFRTHDENLLLNQLKTFSLTNRNDLIIQSITRFLQQAQLAVEVRSLQKSTHVSHSLSLF